jgi:hypothetical protein
MLFFRNPASPPQFYPQRQHSQLFDSRGLRHRDSHRSLHRLQPQVHPRQRRQEGHSPRFQYGRHLLSISGNEVRLEKANISWVKLRLARLGYVWLG